MTYRAQLLGAAFAACASLAVFACGDDDAPAPPATTPDGLCEGDLGAFRFDGGSPDGHADPFGAKGAGQARAGRVRDAAQIVHHPDARIRPRVDDFVMANDKIAVYVEKDGRKNGYTTLGGDIIVVDAVGDDGRPKGVGSYGDTAISFGRQAPKGTVTVLNDGSDGKAAVIRVSGVLTNIPFFDPFRAVAQEEYGFPVAYDYVLEPGAEKVLIRVSLVNTGLEEVPIDKKQFFGFFQGNIAQLFTAESGFAAPKGSFPWLAFDNGSFGFVIRSLTGPLKSDFEVQGFQLFVSSGATLGGCEKKTFDYVEIVGGGPNIDGLLQAKRRAFGEPAGRELRGALKEENGTGLADAWVHAQSADGKYLTRVKTGADGAFVMHVPAGAITLTPTLQGWAIPAATAVPDGANDVQLSLPQRATIDVTAKDAATNEGLPVRVQVIPSTPLAKAPEAFGIREESNGLWQFFSMDGRATLPVPPGMHRVIVSRGYEYELHEEPTVTATAGATTTVDASLARTVESPGVMCADFHIHTSYSLDSNDSFEEKVKGAIADGLEIPVSSEHQYIADFRPVIQKLGVTKWANSILSAELTTFTWGHFGVVPAHLDANLPNNGATDWMGRLPREVFDEVNNAPEKPVIVVNHPRGALFQGYFNVADFDRAQAKGTVAELWVDTFGALEVANGSSFQESRDGSMQDWFALLSAEKTYWAIGNSDSHDMRGSFVGYPRNCLRYGHDDPTLVTPESTRDTLRAGNNVISGGITMTVEGPGGVGPGGKATAGQYKVVVQSPSWVVPATVEVIVDGQTVETRPVGISTATGPGKRFELTFDVQPTTSKARHWVLFHAAGSGDLAPVHPGRTPFAFSNPIFF